MSKKSIPLLEAELRAEKIKSRRLENRVKSLEEKIEKKRIVSESLRRSSPEVAIEKYSNYLKYKYNLLKSTDIWNTTERVVAYSRTSLFIAKLFRYASAIIAFIETSAIFLLCATVLLIVIPVTLISALAFMLIDLAVGKKFNERIIPDIKGKKIIFFIAQKGYRESRNSYFDMMARAFASDGEHYVIVVSKSLRDGLFITARFAGENLVVIRETYFFRLRKAILSSGVADADITVVH